MSQITPDAWIERNVDDPGDPYFEGGEPEEEEPLENQEENDLEKSQNSDEWEQIENQLNHWRDLDIEYWRQRKQKAYSAYLERKLQQQQ